MEIVGSLRSGKVAPEVKKGVRQGTSGSVPTKGARSSGERRASNLIAAAAAAAATAARRALYKVASGAGDVDGLELAALLDHVELDLLALPWHGMAGAVWGAGRCGGARSAVCGVRAVRTRGVHLRCACEVLSHAHAYVHVRVHGVCAHARC